MKCALESCLNSFEPSTHNNIYCSPECCRIATNAKIMERYYANKRKRSGAVRICENDGCYNELSRYNMGDSCAECEAREKASIMNDIKRLFAANGSS